MYVYLSLELMPGILTLLVYLRCGIVKKSGITENPPIAHAVLSG